MVMSFGGKRGRRAGEDEGEHTGEDRVFHDTDFLVIVDGLRTKGRGVTQRSHHARRARVRRTYARRRRTPPG